MVGEKVVRGWVCGEVTLVSYGYAGDFGMLNEPLLIHDCWICHVERGRPLSTKARCGQSREHHGMRVPIGFERAANDVRVGLEA